MPSIIYFQRSIIIIPFLLVFSNFLLDFYISLSSIIFLFLVFCKKIKLKKNFIQTFFIVLFFFYIYLIFNSIFSYNFEVSIFKSITYIRFLIFSLLIFYFLSQDKKILRYLVYSFLICYLILFFDSLIQFYFEKNLIGYYFINGRISSFFGNKLILGSFVSKTLPIILVLINYDNIRIKKINIDNIFILISIILVLLSAERTSLFLTLSIIIFYYLVTIKSLKNFIFKLILFSLIILLVFIIKPSSYDRLVKHTINQISKSYFFAPSFRHGLHYKTAFEIFKHRKIIGNGIYSFRFLCHKPEFNDETLIIEHYKILAPFNGTLKWVSDEKKRIYIIEDTNQNPKKKFFPFYKYTWNFKNETVGKKVKAGEYLYSTSEYINGCNTHPHNYHLQFLSELGLVGYFFLLLFILYIFKIFFKNIFIFNPKKINSSLSINCFSLLLLFLPFIPTGNFFNNWLSINLYLNLSIFMYLMSHATTDNSNNSG